MDNIKFDQDELTTVKSTPVTCNVTVTPLSADNFTLILEILGEDCFFITPKEKNKKSIRTFKSNGFMQPRVCEMELLIGSDKQGDIVTVLTAYTENSNKPEIKLTVQEKATDEIS